MSPNVGNFVQDLVHMAQATERLPQVEAELDENRGQLLQQIAHSQKLEENIIGYKREIEDLQSKVRDAEVARDDAEMRFLELDDRFSKVAKSFQMALEAMDGTDKLIESTKEYLRPTPPTPEPEPIKVDDGGPYNEPKLIKPEEMPMHPYTALEDQAAPQGQSESHPIATPETGASQTAPIQSATTTASVDTTTQNETDKPYSDKLYHDHPTYVPLSDWLAGGGSEENYYRSKPTPPKDYSGAF